MWVILLKNKNSGTGGVLYSIEFVNSNLGFSSSIYGSIIKTTNGGTNWSELGSLHFSIKQIEFNNVS